MKDLYSVNYKTLIEKGEDNSKKWIISHAFGVGKSI